MLEFISSRPGPSSAGWVLAGMPTLGGGVGGQELSLLLSSFHLPYPVKWHSPSFCTVWLEKSCILSIVLLERSLKAIIYPCRGTFICIYIPMGALSLCLRYALAPVGIRKHGTCDGGIYDRCLSFSSLNICTPPPSFLIFS